MSATHEILDGKEKSINAGAVLFGNVPLIWTGEIAVPVPNGKFGIGLGLRRRMVSQFTRKKSICKLSGWQDIHSGR